jgi:hypothetical protein
MSEGIRQAVIKLFDTGAYVSMHQNGALFGMEWLGDSTHYFLNTRQLLYLQERGNLNHEGVKSLSASEQITIGKTIEVGRKDNADAVRLLDKRFEPKNLIAQRDCLLNELSSSYV